MSRVLLMSLPWATPLEPSLGLAILKATYQLAGIPCDVNESHLEMYRWLTHGTYEEIAQTWALCDFTFSGALDDATDSRQLDIAEKICFDSQGHDGKVNFEKDGMVRFNKALKMRQTVIPKFLDAMMAAIDFSRYSLVGFTCLFDQTFASLAMARRIRAAHPGIMLAYGGYALQSPVARHLMTVFPDFMDVVAFGDGEPVAVPLYEASLGIRPLREVPNIYFRNEAGVIEKNREVQIQLDQSPTPDYDDYFHKREEMEKVHQVKIAVPTLPVESSRGCWWGQKNHCVFCGIDDHTMKYRAKSPARVIDDLDTLHRNYGAVNFRFSDYILPHRYFTTLLPELGRLKRPFRIQYESKSNLSNEKMDAMKQGGLFYVQLGVESFSTPVLKRMRKGVTALQNIHSIHGLMKRGIMPYYNLLFGFPGDRRSDYESMIELLPSIYHLVPPGLCIWVQITRFAPLADRHQEYGHPAALRHHWRYDSLFSDTFLAARNLDLSKLCYYFENYNHALIDNETKHLFSVLQHQWWLWKNRDTARGRLSYRTVDGHLEVRDTRAGDKPKTHLWDGAHREVYQLVADDLVDGKRIFERCSHLSRQDVARALEDMLEAQVIIKEESRYLGVAFHESIYQNGVFWWEDRQFWDDFLHKEKLYIRKSRSSDHAQRDYLPETALEESRQ